MTTSNKLFFDDWKKWTIIWVVIFIVTFCIALLTGKSLNELIIPIMVSLIIGAPLTGLAFAIAANKAN